MTQLLNWITYQILNGLKIIEKTKWEGASNRLREKTAPGNSGGRELCSNLWTVRGTLLQTILDNWTVFQDLWDDILEGKVNSGIRGQAIRVQTKSKVSFFFFLIQLGVVLIITDNLSSTLQYTHVMLKRSVNCKAMFFNIKRHRRGS